MTADPTEGDIDTHDLVRELVSSLHHLRHVDLDAVGPALGLAIPPQHPDPSQAGEVKSLSKQERLDLAFDALAQNNHEAVCARFLQRSDLAIELRHRVEDLIWERENWPQITTRTRRDIAEALDAFDAIWLEADGLLNLVKRHWVPRSHEWSFDPKDPYEPVVRHMFRFPNDWTTVEFFKEIGALDGGDRRFALFLEGLLSGSVNPSEARQRKMAAAISPILARAGLKITESGSTDGYPAFAIVAAGTRPRPAQLILFASRHGKPALRLRDVLDQSIEVLTGDDTVLAYDVPVSDRGLTWRDVESWWSHRKGISADQAKLELWRRLVTVCADVSPVQHALFTTYYDYAKDHDPLFALLPEVWLHWDPVSRRQRGENAFLDQRMDFLMLLPGLRRVVLEVDGEQHYATSSRQPSPRIYSETTRGDRDLRLTGYEVYRFSGYELSEDRATNTVAEFFNRLLARI
ncbi:hypothetical protein [Fodinicola acaciae]|uniref:AbiJ-related protein n=1 Tax=Fodinicola acaciae TaxID=2681555 RepID=UPI0013CF874A|nr:hypothetical protein [Fodinicola acaciae]